MKIGIVTTWFERGAAYVSRQFKDILASEHEVVIYARGGESYAIGDPNWDHDYVTWGEPAETYAFSDINLKQFKQWLTENNIDIVLFNEQKIWAPVLLCRELGIRTGAYIDYYTEQTVPMFGVHDFLICNTKRHHSVFDWHPQCFYIPWGTDTTLYSPQNDCEPANKGQVTFFHSAGMSPFRKGSDLVIEAFAKLSGDAKLVLHSQVKIEKHFPELTETVASLTASGRIEVHDYTVSAPGLFHLGDVYVYPSRLDGIGLTIMEAAASGLQLIVSDNGPMNEFVEVGTNGATASIEKLWARWDGYYWPQCEVAVDDLADKMQQFVDNQSQIKALKQQSRDYAEQHFDWTKNTSNLNSLMTQVRLLDEREITAARSKCTGYDQKLFERHKKTLRQSTVDYMTFHHPELYSKISKLKKALG